MTRGLLASACALLFSVGGASAWAQNPGDPEPPEDPIAAEAQLRYQRGRQLYLDGRYDEAVRELESALALDPDEPVLLYNLALVHEKLDHFADAIGYLRRYLDTGLQGDDRARVEATLRRLEGARQHATPDNPRVIRVAVPVPVERPRREGRLGRADALFFVTAAIAVAALGTTVVTGAMALSEQTEVDRFYLGEDGTLAERRAHLLNANDLALVADVALATGCIAAVTATLLYATRRAPPEQEPRASAGVSIGPGGVTATVQGRF